MKTGDLKRLILTAFGNREFYGYDVHRELESKNVRVELSRLYRVLNGMSREGLLRGRWEKSGFGPRRRVYRLGKTGMKERRRILLDAIEKVHGFYEEYLLSLPPEASAFAGVSGLLTGGLRGRGDIAYVAGRLSTMHKRMIRTLCSSVPKGKVFLVKPAPVAVDLKLDNLFFLDGRYDDIPLKGAFLDLLVVASRLRRASLGPALREWNRVIRRDGTVAILTPTALIRQYEDPLTIGDFMEKREHEAMEGGKTMDRDFLKARLKRVFGKLEEKRIAHMTVFLASKPRPPRR